MSASESESSHAPPPAELKVVLLGASSVGKTALVERFLHDSFHAGTQATIGAAYASKRVATQAAGTVVMCVWDTAGQERYRAVASMYYRGSRAAIVCYDITEPASLASAKLWADELAMCEPNCRVYVCGCKLDLSDRRRVTFGAAKSFADSIGAQAWETSSKTGANVAELFATIAEDFAALRRHSKASAPGDVDDEPGPPSFHLKSTDAVEQQSGESSWCYC